jgi:putative DNA primase/helicase
MDDLWNVVNPAKCLYCDGESLWDDIQNMGDFTGLGDTHILSKTYLEYLDITPSLNLTESIVRDSLYDYIIKHEFKFVVLDNLFSLWAGIDLDNAKEWHEPNQWLLKLRSKGVCVVLLHHTNKQGGQMGTASKLFNLNTALILKKTLPQQRNYNGEEITSFGIKVEKQRVKGTGLEDYTFTCDDGAWSYTKKKENTGLNEDSTAFYIVLLLLNGRIKKQADIGKLVGCNSSYVSQVKKYPKYKNFFYGDGSPTSDGIEFLNTNRDNLTSFYDQKGLDVG